MAYNMLTMILEQGDRDGYYHDRVAECWKDFVVASSGGKLNVQPINNLISAY
jgi:hypothetical protein